MINISQMSMAIVVGIGVFFGIYWFGYDMAYYSDGSPKYDIGIPESTAGNMTALSDTLENTTGDLVKALSGSESWTKTAYNLFFALPNSVISTLAATANAGGKMLGIMVGPESVLPVPDWVIVIVGIMISLVIIFTLLRLILGGDG